MRFSDLTNDQRLELKQGIVKDRNENLGEGTSYGELIGADELVSDKELEETYAGTEFSPDDFSCGEAADRDGVLDELQEWAERELVDRNFAKSKGRLEPIHWDEHVGIEWAKQSLLEHIKAVHDDERDWEAEALKYAESIGVYEYKVNGRFIEYWSFYGKLEGWYFIRYDLREKRERFRGANIPWDDEVRLPAPGFLRTKDGATKYNYMVG